MKFIHLLCECEKERPYLSLYSVPLWAWTVSKGLSRTTTQSRKQSGWKFWMVKVVGSVTEVSI